MVRWLPLLASATVPRSPVFAMSTLICWVERPVELASALINKASPMPNSRPSQAGANLKKKTILSLNELNCISYCYSP